MRINSKIKCEILKLFRDKFDLNSPIFDCNKLSFIDSLIISTIFINRLNKIKKADLYEQFIKEWSKRYGN